MEEVVSSNLTRSTNLNPTKHRLMKMVCVLPPRGRGHAESIWSPNPPEFGLQPVAPVMVGKTGKTGPLSALVHKSRKIEPALRVQPFNRVSIRSADRPTHCWMRCQPKS